MSFAYLPLYTGDYFRDTRGLSMASHGCYFLFLTYCWDKRGPLPLDEEQLAQICNARNQEERLTMQRILSSYFTRMDDGWYQQRMQREIERAEAISRERSEAGRKGYQAKAKQLSSKSQASASIPTTNTIPTPLPEKKEREAERLRATRLPPLWQLPQEWQDWAVKVYHLDPKEVVRISLDFKDYWLAKPGSAGTKLDWLATWRRWIRKETANA